MTRDLIGLEMFHKDRLAPRFLPEGEDFGVMAEVYSNKKYGATVTIYPWKRFNEQMWDKRHRWFLRQTKKKQAKIIKEQEEWKSDNKLVYTKNWRKVTTEDMKRIIAENLIFTYLTTDPLLKSKYIGRVESLMWHLHSTNPPWRKHSGWTNYSIHGWDGSELVSLEEVCNILEGTRMTPSRRLMKSFITKRKKHSSTSFKIKTIKHRDGSITVKAIDFRKDKDPHKSYMQYAKDLESRMIKVTTNTRDR